MRYWIFIFLLSFTFLNSKEEHQPYVFFNFGLGLPEKEGYKSAVPYQLTVGRQFLPFVALTVNFYGEYFDDAELTAFKIDKDKEELELLIKGSNKRVESLFLNLEINDFFPFTSFIDPYLGLGLGEERIYIKSEDDSKTRTRSDQFVYQVYLGVRIKLNSEKGIFGEYRFHRRSEDVGNINDENEQEKLLDGLVDEKDDSWLLGMYYSF